MGITVISKSPEGLVGFASLAKCGRGRGTRSHGAITPM